MTRIENFAVEGLAGRERTIACELAPDINVFFGLNGSGKTSLLRVLFAALRNSTDIIARTPFIAANVAFFSHDREYTIRRTISKSSIREVDNAARIYHEFYDDHGSPVRVRMDSKWVSDPEDSKPYRVTYLSTSRLAVLPAPPYYNPYISSPTESSQADEARLEESFATSVSALWQKYTNELLSVIRTVQEDGLTSILQSLFATVPSQQRHSTSKPARHTLDADTAYTLTTGFLKRQGAKPPATLKSFRDQYDEDAKLRSVVEDIYKTEQRIERAEQPRRELERIVREFMTEGKELVFTDQQIAARSESGEDIPLASMSSGEKQLLRIFLEVINSERNTVIIDEPELSMHIDWQRQLLASLRVLNPAAQLIVATHSPEIMADVPDDRIFRL